MDAEQIILQLFQHAALRRRSFEQGWKINSYNKSRISFMQGAVEGVELIIKSLNLWERYIEWSEKQCKNKV